MTYQTDLDLVLEMAERFASEGAIADRDREDGDPKPADVEAAIARLRADPSILGVTLGNLLSVASYANEFVTDWREDEGLEDVDRQRANAAADVVDRVQANLPAAWRLLMEAAPAVKAHTALRHASGALSATLEQISQMSGMFNDEDGTIQDAVEAAEESRDEIEAALTAEPAEPITVAVTISGGVMQGSFMSRPGVKLYVVDYDQDGVEEGRLVNMSEGDEEFASVWIDSTSHDPDWIKHIVAKAEELNVREKRFEAEQCVLCGGANDQHGNDEGTGICSLCNGSEENA